MSSRPYISCIKIGGVPIIPPLMTSEIREQCTVYKLKAIEKERKRKRNHLFKKCVEDLERLEQQTKELTVQTTLESQLAFADSPSHVPYQTYKKLQNLTSETIDVSEYSNKGVKVLTNEEQKEIPKTPPPKLIRSNSYTLESPSPVLLAHLEKEARKCVELDDSDESFSPVTIIDSEAEPPLQVVETDFTVQQVVVSTPNKLDGRNIDPQLFDVLSSLPDDHAKNILQILSTQQENHKTIKDQIIEDDKTIVSISSQSLYFSTLSPDTSRESPNQLNVVNLRNSRNTKMDKDRAASVIQAYVRGYLVRRLLRTDKIQGYIKTIQDSLMCAIQLHHADVIEEADVELHRRLIQQVSGACYAFHDVFFSLSTKEQMVLIALDRQKRVEKAGRSLSVSGSSLSLSGRQSARSIR